MINSITDKANDLLKGTFADPKGHVNVNTTERVLSVAAGTVLLVKGLKNLFSRPFAGLQGAALGGALLYRGATGYCYLYDKINKDTTDIEAVSISETFVVNRPRAEVYQFWRKLENLPKFMKHLHSVEEVDEKLSYWRANVPGELIKINWQAEITREEENSYIGWQSVEGSMIDNAGKVQFIDALNGEGTELNIEISYFPPAGVVGQGIAKLLNGMFEKMVRDDVTNFKHYVEGEDYKIYSNSKTV